MARAASVVLPLLRYWRIQLGLTRQQLAERSTLSRGTVLRIETGSPALMRTARLLAKALDVQVADLQRQPPVDSGNTRDGRPT